MLKHVIPYLERAEATAENGLGIGVVLEILRGLSLDDFGQLLLSLPNAQYPSLSSILPSMASDKIQKEWTGASGIELLRQTSSFARQLESIYVRNTRRPMRGANILDFGCGYGRLTRMMYYYSNPEQIWGVDAWQKSLNICRENNLLGNFALSDRLPDSLPVGNTKFDVAFAFSVFTHLSPKAADACLAAVRKHMVEGGLFIATFRPIEFWSFFDRSRGTSYADIKIAEHQNTGSAYLPHHGSEGETYGDITVDLSFFERSGWSILGYDRSLADSFQLSAILRAI